MIVRTGSFKFDHARKVNIIVSFNSANATYKQCKVKLSICAFPDQYCGCSWDASNGWWIQVVPLNVCNNSAMWHQVRTACTIYLCIVFPYRNMNLTSHHFSWQIHRSMIWYMFILYSLTKNTQDQCDKKESISFIVVEKTFFCEHMYKINYM